MKKKQQQLSELKIQSFVTEFAVDGAKTAKGGSGFVCHSPYCGSIIDLRSIPAQCGSQMQ